MFSLWQNKSSGKNKTGLMCAWLFNTKMFNEAYLIFNYQDSMLLFCLSDWEITNANKPVNIQLDNELIIILDVKWCRKVVPTRVHALLHTQYLIFNWLIDFFAIKLSIPKSSGMPGKPSAVKAQGVNAKWFYILLYTIAFRNLSFLPHDIDK